MRAQNTLQDRREPGLACLQVCHCVLSRSLQCFSLEEFPDGEILPSPETPLGNQSKRAMNCFSSRKTMQSTTSTALEFTIIPATIIYLLLTSLQTFIKTRGPYCRHTAHQALLHPSAWTWQCYILTKFGQIWCQSLHSCFLPAPCARSASPPPPVSCWQTQMQGSLPGVHPRLIYLS